MLNAGAAFDTEGKNTAGDNNLVGWDMKENKLKFSVNLSEFADEGHRGFQDMEHDEDGNIFGLSSFGGSILRVGAQDQKVEKWWVSESSGAVHGITGLARFGQDTLIVADQAEQGLFRHSMKADGKDKREQIKLTSCGSAKSANSTSAKLTATLDGVYFPPQARSGLPPRIRQHRGNTRLDVQGQVAKRADARHHPQQVCLGHAHGLQRRHRPDG